MSDDPRRLRMVVPRATLALPLLALFLPLLAAPGAMACTPAPGPPQHLVVTKDGEELVRIPAGEQPSDHCGPVTVRPPPFDGRFLVWGGQTFDLDARAVLPVPGTAGQVHVEEGRLVALHHGALTVADLRAGTPPENPETPPLARLSGLLAWGEDGDQIVVFDAEAGAWLVRADRAALGLPADASPTLRGVMRDWLVFDDRDGDRHAAWAFDVRNGTTVPLDLGHDEAYVVGVAEGLAYVQQDVPFETPSYHPGGPCGTCPNHRTETWGLRLPSGERVAARLPGPVWEVDGRRIAFVTSEPSGSPWMPLGDHPQATASMGTPPSPGASSGGPFDPAPSEASVDGPSSPADVPIPAVGAAAAAVVVAAACVLAVRRRL